MSDDFKQRYAELEAQEKALLVERAVLLAMLKELGKPFKKTSKSERFAFIKRHKQAYPMTPMLHVLEVSRSGYTKWQARVDAWQKRMQSLGSRASLDEARERAEFLVLSQGELSDSDLARECCRRLLPVDKNALIGALAQELYSDGRLSIL